MHHRRRRARLAIAVAVTALLVAPLSLPIPAAGGQDAFPVQLVRVHTPTQADKDRLITLGLDLTEHGGADFVEAVLHSSADASTLLDHGFDWDVEIPDLAARSAQNRRADAAYAAAVDESPLPSGRTTYRLLADYEAELAQLAADHPGLVRRFALPHPTLEGRTVWGVEISQNVEDTTDGKPVFLMMGLHHAREWPSGEHSMEFAIDLAEHAGKDPRIDAILASTRVLVVPVVNPDGFDQSRKWGELVDLRELDGGDITSILLTPGNAYKRKNCRTIDGQPAVPGACEAPSPGGFGTGVDLNRNYGGQWGGPGASDLFADPDYRGAAPFSEPETQNVRELISRRHVTTLITNHTFSNLVLRPPGVRATGETPDEPAMRQLGAKMTRQNGYRNIQGWQLYDTHGTTEDWSYNATGGYGFTFEIGPDEFHPPFETGVVDEYLGAGFYAGRGNREAFLVAAEAAADPEHHAVIAGSAPPGAVLRLTKSFATKTALSNADGSRRVIQDRLESTLAVGDDGTYEWHVNPSTRPEVMQHRLRILDQEPTREEVFERSVVWTPGDTHEIPFTLADKSAGALQVDLDWPTPDDLDLYVYFVNPDGSRIEVGSSGNFINEKETALIELPEAGDYVIEVVNYASASATFTVTAGVYGVDRVERFGDNLVESYTLTCERPDGTVLETREVTVDREQSQKVDLTDCAAAFAGI